MAVAQVVNTGTQANDATGDLLRDAFTKINANFAALFAGNFPAAQLTIGPPLSGTALSVIGLAGQSSITTSIGTVTIGAPTSGTALTVSGASGANVASIGGLTVSTAGNLTVASPTSGTALTVSGVAGSNVAVLGGMTIATTGAVTLAAASGGATTLTVNPQATNGVISINAAGMNMAFGTTFLAGTSELYSANALNIGTTSANATSLYSNGLARLAIASTGGLTVNAPTSGVALALPNTASVNVLTAANLNVGVGVNFTVGASEIVTTGTNPIGFGTVGAATVKFWVNSLNAMSLGTTGTVTIAAPASGDALTITNVAGANALTLAGNSAGTAVLRLNTQATTGAQTATFAANNKPGSGTTGPDKWIPINLDGTTHYVPAFL